MQKIVLELETPDVIKKRLETAYSVLWRSLKYANPDCGLAFWPDQDLAFKLLENTAKGINQFNAERYQHEKWKIQLAIYDRKKIAVTSPVSSVQAEMVLVNGSFG